MKVVILKHFGGPENLELNNHPNPSAVSDFQVLVRVRACAVSTLDIIAREGRFFGEIVNISLSAPAVPGYQISGTIENVGSKVSGFAIGDEVSAFLPVDKPGGSAEYIIVDAFDLVKKPKSVSHDDAAACMGAAVRAFTALHHSMRLRPEDSVLICNGASGYGHIAIQVARLLGLRVYTTASSTEEVSFLTSIPHARARIIDLRHEDLCETMLSETDGLGVDGIIDDEDLIFCKGLLSRTDRQPTSPDLVSPTSISSVSAALSKSGRAATPPDVPATSPTESGRSSCLSPGRSTRPDSAGPSRKPRSFSPTRASANPQTSGANQNMATHAASSSSSSGSTNIPGRMAAPPPRTRSKRPSSPDPRTALHAQSLSSDAASTTSSITSVTTNATTSTASTSATGSAASSTKLPSTVLSAVQAAKGRIAATRSKSHRQPAVTAAPTSSSTKVALQHHPAVRKPVRMRSRPGTSQSTGSTSERSLSGDWSAGVAAGEQEGGGDAVDKENSTPSPCGSASGSLEIQVDVATAEEDWSRERQQHDRLATHIRCLAPHGRICTTSPFLQLSATDTRDLFLRNASLCFLFENVWVLSTAYRHRYLRILEYAMDALTKGDIKVRISHIFQLDEFQHAHHTVCADNIGAVVLRI